MPSTVVASPTTVEQPRMRPVGDAAALAFRRRVKVIDRLATWLISFSGIAIIIAVLGIGVFLFHEVLPLLHPARIYSATTYSVVDAGQIPRLILLDEYQEKALILGTSPVIRVIALNGRPEPSLETFPLEGLEDEHITSAARNLHDPTIAIGTSKGLIWVGDVSMNAVFHGQQRSVEVSIQPQAMIEAVPGYSIDALAFRRSGDRSLAAMIVGKEYLIVDQLFTRKPIIGPDKCSQQTTRLPIEQAFGLPTAVLIDETGTQLSVGTSKGFVIRWEIPAQGSAKRLEVVPVVQGSVTAMAYLLGGRSFAIGGSNGSVAVWSLVQHASSSDSRQLTRIHVFKNHPASISLITPSERNRSFLTASVDGRSRLHFMTTGRTFGEVDVGSEPLAADFAPKADGAVWVNREGRLFHWLINNPHAEFSWRVLFGKIEYEGYEKPEYIWQSTGGSDDFESKFSLVPLIFGTFKGTFYALLFAVPLSLFGALYCSQFLDKHLRNPVKSTIELMAALPSVVLGFLSGVVLAPLVQSHIACVLALPVILPFTAVAGMVLIRLLPASPAAGFLRRHEFWMLTLWVILGFFAALLAGPFIERFLFKGDFQSWLMNAAGTRYDQRNSLVVGWAMGFAVIPIIFTICEDAFSAVPKHLTSASLACGASLWQTAWRIVLPAAGSGVFSAIMIGFGRAIGETMIVLMATGNTPVMDWSLFNGFRALSANIAVEVSEAPYGGTLYRILFVAALMLFGMTFIVNTLAELIRLRLRNRLKGI